MSTEACRSTRFIGDRSYYEAQCSWIKITEVSGEVSGSSNFGIYIYGVK
jgi:hypothetical protein